MPLFISLIPKVVVPKKVIDYRPISCCNVVYKTISKVITNRIKRVLSGLVGENQSAFIPGRQISDNILLTQEFMRGYQWNVGQRASRCAFKIDIQKAYDTVNWKFLEFILKCFGFHPIMINWIMVCLTTASFSVCINGEAHGFFKAGRGLRQGDPISPYLFTLVMEVLNLMIKRHVVAEKKFKYHWGCKELKITSLCFADDLLMLCHGDLVSASVLRRGLDDFCLCSGLLPSMSKSEAFFGNVSSSVKADIGLVMPFKEGVLPIKYLGVPMVSKRITDRDCKVMVEVIRKRVGDWRNKSLSFAGRLQLISSILNSLQVYWSALFMLPIHTCNQIDRILKNFLWTGGGSNKGIVSVSWKEICKPKSQGGLGLRSAHFWNEALLAKHIWNIVSRKDSLWVKWVNVYKLKGRSMWDIELDRGSSWCWKSLLDLRSRIERFVQVKIGNGRDCNIWFDKWHPCGPLSRLITHRILECADMSLKLSVNDMIEGNEWVWPIEWDDRFKEVTNVPVPNLRSDVEDKTVWIDKKGKEKRFSVREVWKAIRIDCPKVIWYRHVWFSQCIPRHAFILWVAIKGRLKTLDRISRWVNTQSMVCYLCNQGLESHNHLFFSCPFSKRLWERLKPLAKLEGISNDWACIISFISNKPATNTIWSIIQRLVLGACVYFLWQERNCRCFVKKFRDVECLYKIIVDIIRMKLMGLTMKCSPDVLAAASIWNFKINKSDYYRRMVEELLKEDIFNGT
ncbi:RNA-directed DNA polymerase, eukaryota, reverse transcriptase zinc-binding domain protein [Tanacetum coccineum]